MARPAIIGTTNRNTIVVPCIVNSWLYVCGLTSVFSGAPSCRRIISASAPPRMKNTNVRTMYMIPIRLWSVVVSQLMKPRPSGSTRRARTWGTGAVAGAA